MGKMEKGKRKTINVRGKGTEKLKKVMTFFFFFFAFHFYKTTETFSGSTKMGISTEKS